MSEMKQGNKNVVALIGFMGTGKSIVGRILAQKLNFSFIDLDEEIVKKTGISITDYFNVKGETAFRALETSLLRKTLDKSNTVIACGGGIIIRENNRILLSRKAVVVWLRNSIETSVDRCKDISRPLLNTGDALTTAKQIYAGREKFYRETAEIVYDTDQLPAEEIALRIFQHINMIS
jgi:shikimate kinase